MPLKYHVFQWVMAVLAATVFVFNLQSCSGISQTSDNKSETIESIYMVYGGYIHDTGEMVHTCETYQEAIDFCNKEPISDPCIIFKVPITTDIVPECTRDSNGNPIKWGANDKEAF